MEVGKAMLWVSLNLTTLEWELLHCPSTFLASSGRLLK